MYVSIHQENKAFTNKHIQHVDAHSPNMQTLFYVLMFVCVHASVGKKANSCNLWAT